MVQPLYLVLMQLNYRVGNNSLFVSGSGNIGIGTTTPIHKLDINGVLNVASSDVSIRIGGTGIFGITTAGNFPSTPGYTRFIGAGMVFSGKNDNSVQLVVNPSTGNIGINTTSPTAKLQVKGSGTTSATTAFRVENANASTSMVVLDNGNVGIGTTTPSYKLDVAGDIIARDIYPTIYVDHSGTVLGGIRADATTKLEFKTLTTAPLSFQVNSDEKMRITDSGTVGIGTYSPTAKLQVKGSGTTNATTAFRVENANASGSMVVLDNGIVGIGTDTPRINLHISSDTGGQIYFTDTDFASSANTHNINSANGVFQIGTRNNNGSFVDTFYQVITSVSGATSQYFLTQGTSRILINNAGNVGIGTTSPTSRLQVKGSGTTSATTALLVENANASASMVVLDNGNVGIGRIPFSYTVDISGSFRVQTNTLGLVVGTNGATEILTTGGNNGLYINDGNYSILKLGDYRFVQGRSAKTLSIRDSADIDVMFFASGSKNVGIGTTTPSYKLDVSGSGNFTNNLTVTGSATISSILTLIPQDPLPAGSPTGSFAVSSSVPPKPYFYDGTVWNALY
jgi:hypothetical protein